jgi:phage terminase large subunit
MSLINSLRSLPPKQALAAALAEKQRRLSLKKQQTTTTQLLDADGVLSTNTNYSPVLDRQHPLYDLLHKKARTKVYWGGRGSMKSWGIAEALIRTAARRQVRVLCVREFQNSMADSSHALLAATIIRLGLSAFFRVTEGKITSVNGSTFIFKGMHGNEQGIRSTFGVDICWVEEAQTVSKSSWDALTPTIREAGAEIWVSYNLINETDATHARFVNEDGSAKRTDSIVHKINYDKNPFFRDSPMYQEMLDDKAASQHLYEHIWLGMPMVMDDSIVLSGKYVEDEFDDNLSRKADRLFFGVDWGYAQDPSACVRMFIIEQTFTSAELDMRQAMLVAGQHVPPPWRDLYVSHEAYRRGVELDDYTDFFKPIPDIRDWPVKADCSQPATISHVGRTCALNMDGAEKWPGSVEDGVRHLRGYRTIHVHPRCVNVLKECRLYSYKVDKITKEVLPVIVDKHNHCVAEGSLITTQRGLVPIEHVTTADRVLTRDGWKPVLWAGVTDTNREVLQITTRSGQSVRVTPDHEVLVNGVWMRADAIRYDDEVVITGSNACPTVQTPFIESSREEGTRSTRTLATTATTLLASVCMWLCGKTLTEWLFQKITKFIMSIMTRRTTRPAIWNASRLRSITHDMPQSEHLSSSRACAKTWQKQASSRRNGTQVKRAELGTQSMQGEALQADNLCARTARTVVTAFWTRASGIKQAFVQTRVSQPQEEHQVSMMLSVLVSNVGWPSKLTSTATGPLAVGRVVSVLHGGNAARVYDLTVAEQHEFFANGILVHNCMDAMRYGLDGYIQRSGSLSVWEKLAG